MIFDPNLDKFLCWSREKSSSFLVEPDSMKNKKKLKDNQIINDEIDRELEKILKQHLESCQEETEQWLKNSQGKFLKTPSNEKGA